MSSLPKSIIAALPRPVERYFNTVLRPGQHMIRSAKIQQRGTFCLRDSWKPFEAEETIKVSPIEFAWDAHIRAAPFASVHVEDAYRNRKGSMRATMFFGLFTLVDANDASELNSGALHRYLAEAVWLPTALLPECGVQWTPLNDTQAVASLADGSAEVSVTFTFGSSGEIESMSTARYRENKGRYIPTPWGSTCTRYEERNGIRIPTESEVFWVIDGVKRPYWRGEITQIEYELGD